jgi:hypothetical protein
MTPHDRELCDRIRQLAADFQVHRNRVAVSLKATTPMASEVRRQLESIDRDLLQLYDLLSAMDSESAG